MWTDVFMRYFVMVPDQCLAVIWFMTDAFWDFLGLSLWTVRIILNFWSINVDMDELQRQTVARQKDVSAVLLPYESALMFAPMSEEKQDHSGRFHHCQHLSFLSLNCPLKSTPYSFRTSFFSVRDNAKHLYVSFTCSLIFSWSHEHRY